MVQNLLHKNRRLTRRNRQSFVIALQLSNHLRDAVINPVFKNPLVPKTLPILFYRCLRLLLIKFIKFHKTLL